MNRSAFVVLLVVVVALFACADAGALKKKDCPGDNEHWTNCGTHCEATCERPEPRACILSCKLDVCQCDEGFYRSSSGRCVELHECNKY